MIILNFVIAVAGVQNHHHVVLVDGEERQAGVGTQGLNSSHFSSRHVIPASLSDASSSRELMTFSPVVLPLGTSSAVW